MLIFTKSRETAKKIEKKRKILRKKSWYFLAIFLSFGKSSEKILRKLCYFLKTWENPPTQWTLFSQTYQLAADFKIKMCILGKFVIIFEKMFFFQLRKFSSQKLSIFFSNRPIISRFGNNNAHFMAICCHFLKNDFFPLRFTVCTVCMNKGAFII